MKQKKQATNIVIIGAGVVGCAISHALAKAGHSVIVLEKNARIADGITSRNSGVIHAGLYYPKGSLKAESCLRGNSKLYEWCERKNVPHKKLGKWIVGASSDETELREAFENAKSAGATGIRWGSTAEIAALESFGILAGAGYFSANTGIVDAYAYSKSFQVAAEEFGASYVLSADVKNIQKNSDQFTIETSRGPIECDYIINAAGLYGDEIHQMLGFSVAKIYPYRGDYFRLTKKYLTPHLIYPLKKKNAAGLGIHLTLDLDGSCKLGPDVTIVQSKEDFAPPANLAEKQNAFYEAGRKFLKNLALEDLHYDTCGIRPKLRAPSDTEEKDFMVEKFGENYIALLGIESPGLTAAIDLADRVLKLI